MQTMTVPKYRVERNPDDKGWDVIDRDGEIVAAYGDGQENKAHAQAAANLYNRL